ncbi:2-oxo acid dehydrogenase subunit E2 [Mesorhizobium sp. 1M-11]|uniref:2-oxo acid dehydrogenase subunit E2 n=1 Tax=Mesorhizobium sp. 1M-11 TaxID=1529006 RepID=UPI0006C767EA|nr:2-oxo acid dehydrogenase subunit E2 [Mesorhizobium sp. 1M-11]
MPTPITLPVVSPNMESAKLVKWLFAEGQAVSAGDELVEIETDKATLTIESPNNGKLGSILVSEGTEDVKVGTPIAILLADGESAVSIQDVLTPPTAETPPTTEDPRLGTPTASEPKPSSSVSKREDRPRAFASPLARRIAQDAAIDLGTVRGSGPQGRILKVDVLTARDARTTKPSAPVSTGENNAITPIQPATTAAPIQSAGLGDVGAIYRNRPHKIVSVDGMRKTIAERLSTSKQTVPHYYLRGHIIADQLLALRADFNAQLQHRGVKLSINDFIVKACGLALQQVPECNSVWADNKILRLGPSDVAVAIAVENGLFTPVVRDAQSASLSAIANAVKNFSLRAKQRSLSAEDYAGGSMTISNLGMFGVESFDAIINPPQATILAVGACVTKMVEVGDSGEMKPTKTIAVSLSIDHRVIDGAQGAIFLKSIRAYLENPMSMLA